MRRVVVVLALLAAACDESPTPIGPDGTPDPTATFTRVQNEIFTPTCATAACHDTGSAQSGLILVAGRAYGQIVNVRSVENTALMRILPNDPSNSYLFRKITGTGISGDRMPQGQSSLNAQQIALVRDWIRRGAPQD